MFSFHETYIFEVRYGFSYVFRTKGLIDGRPRLKNVDFLANWRLHVLFYVDDDEISSPFFFLILSAGFQCL